MLVHDVFPKCFKICHVLKRSLRCIAISRSHEDKTRAACCNVLFDEMPDTKHGHKPHRRGILTVGSLVIILCCSPRCRRNSALCCIPPYTPDKIEVRSGCESSSCTVAGNAPRICPVLMLQPHPLHDFLL